MMPTTTTVTVIDQYVVRLAQGITSCRQRLISHPVSHSSAVGISIRRISLRLLNRLPDPQSLDRHSDATECVIELGIAQVLILML